MSFQLTNLKFGYNELEPYIDARTMEIHHTKYYTTYLDKFNEAIKETELELKSLEEIFSHVSSYPDSVRNNGGGYFNHKLFWQILAPGSETELEIRLSDAVNKYFGTLEELKEEFTDSAASFFGSGWTWLVKRIDGELYIMSTPNQDNPLMDVSPTRGIPILCLDLWEHAYYLGYQNRRRDYIQAFWNVVNWDRVSELFNNY